MLKHILKLALLLPILGLTLQAVASEADAPADQMRAFLKWYLPVAFDKGADAVYDKRMDSVIEAKVLAQWRKEQRQEGGIGAVPFVGQDFDPAWAKNYEVVSSKIKGKEAILLVQYTAPSWSQKLRVTMLSTPEGWRISDYEPMD